MRTAPAIAAAAALLVGATACGERSEPVGPSAAVYPLTVRGIGDTPTVARARPHRIAAVAPWPARTLAALGAADLLVGNGLGALNGPPLQSALKRLRPDLIVGSGESDSGDLSRAGKATGAPVYITPDSNLLQVERAIDDLGLLAGRGFQARATVARIQKRAQAVHARLAGKKPVHVFVDTGYFSTIGDRTLLGDLVRKGGGINVAGANPEAGPISPAELQKLDPDVYLATSDSGTTLRRLRASPATRRLRAVREGRFGVVPAALTQPGPQIGDGLATVARLLHPDAFR
jgi:ABC-type Fe3+-hydroxamate transport system substrate-binding protein